MLSALVFITWFIAAQSFAAWAMAAAARAVGSKRGRFRVGLLIVAIMLALNAAVMYVDARWLPDDGPRQAMVFGLAILGASVLVLFLLLRSAFALTVGRTFAPLAALLGAQAVAVAFWLLVTRPLVTEGFILPTEDMSPTLEPNDRFFINKLQTPRRLDLVAYWNRGVQTRVYCKRLLALPGERLRFEGGEVWINDERLALPPPLVGRCRASVRSYPQPFHYSDGETIELGKNEYFFIGDNVDRSADSRQFGPTTELDIIGVVDAVYWPPSRMRLMRGLEHGET